MKTIRKETSVSGKVVELLMVLSARNFEYYYIYSDNELMHSQYDNNSRLNAIFNECVNEDFDLIWAY